MNRGLTLTVLVILSFAFCASVQADPVIKWLTATEGEGDATSKLGALYYGSQLKYTSTYSGGGAVEGPLNQKYSTIISVDANNNTGASYSDAVFYAEAISDTTINNGRNGLIDGTQDGGWGRLQIFGKAISTRSSGYVRTYSEATADAYVTFSIEDDTPRTAPVLVKFTIEFANVPTDQYNGDLQIFRNRDPVAGTADRFVNFATFGGLTQDGRPPSYFIIEEDLNPSQRIYDIYGNPVVHMFDDPSRPEQFDANLAGGTPSLTEQYFPYGTPGTNKENVLWGPGSGRGGPIPLGTSSALNTNRTWLYMDNSNGLVDAIEMQEPLLQDPVATNPANDPLYTDRMNGTNATAIEYSRGNTTFNDGLVSQTFYFEIQPDELGDPFSIYAQLSANLAVDGGIDGWYGGNPVNTLGPQRDSDYATLFYHIEIVPEPATIIMIGLGAAGLAGIARRKLGGGKTKLD
ncbi:MAG: PEP-CTERM sorting domain-containing protein [Planctomycetota bacterium]